MSPYDETVKVSPEAHKALKKLCVDEELRIDETADQAIREFVEEQTGEEIPEPTPRTPDDPPA